MIDKFEGKYFFLSNFYRSEVEYEGIMYPTVEHAFQAAKTMNTTKRMEIAMLLTPGQAKRAGRMVELRKDWEQVKDQVMYNCVKAKFSDPQLAEMLLATGDEMLVEGTTWHDNYWGNCTCSRCQNLTGRNQLGITLMKVREELQNGK